MNTPSGIYNHDSSNRDLKSSLKEERLENRNTSGEAHNIYILFMCTYLHDTLICWNLLGPPQPPHFPRQEFNCAVHKASKSLWGRAEYYVSVILLITPRSSCSFMKPQPGWWRERVPPAPTSCWTARCDAGQRPEPRQVCLDALMSTSVFHPLCTSNCLRVGWFR